MKESAALARTSSSMVGPLISEKMMTRSEGWELRSLAAASRPFMRGMRKSRSARSSWLCMPNWTAFTPSLAVQTTWNPPANSRYSQTERRAVGESSAIRTRIGSGEGMVQIALLKRFNDEGGWEWMELERLPSEK